MIKASRLSSPPRPHALLFPSFYLLEAGNNGEVFPFPCEGKGVPETRGVIAHWFCTRNNARTSIHIFAVIITVLGGGHHLHFSDGESGT